MEWNREEVEKVRARAEGGGITYRALEPVRSSSLMDSLAIVVRHSAPPRNGPVDLSTELSRKGEGLPALSSPLPLFVKVPRLGDAGRSARHALVTGAAEAGIPVEFGVDGPSDDEVKVLKERRVPWLLQVTPSRQSLTPELLSGCVCIELRLGGAWGGVVHSELDPENPVERHLELTGPDELSKLVELFRSVTEYKVPVLARFGAGRLREDAAWAAGAGVDGLHIECSPGGAEIAPEVVQESLSLPLAAAMPPVLRGLKDGGCEDLPVLISGGARDGADVFKLMAMGAAAVGLDTAARVAVGCALTGICATGQCPTGVATTDPALESKLDRAEGGKRLARFIQALASELDALMLATGHSRLSDLGTEDLRTLDYDAAAVTGLKLAGFDRPLPMWSH